MKISGLQKLTLLDFPGKMACTVFTHGCNFRCGFCHNSRLVTQKQTDFISQQEVLSFLRKRQGILEGVCITGGEPTLQKDLKEFIREIKNLGYLVKVDTNGTKPEVIGELIDEKLVDYIAMDIKNSPEKYSGTCGCEVDIDSIRKSVSIIIESGVDHEFRTTTAKELQTKEDFLAIAQWLQGSSKYYLQQFIDSGEIIEGSYTPFSKQEMSDFAESIRSKMPNVALRGV